MLETLDWRIAQLQLFIYFWEGRGGEGCGVGVGWEGGEFRNHHAPDILPSIFLRSLSFLVSL